MQLKKKMGWLILLAGLIPFAVVFWLVDDWGRDFSQNTASTSPRADDPWLRPAELDESPGDVLDRLEQWTKQHALWEVDSIDQATDRISIDLIRTTRFLRFKDDIHVEIELANEGSRVSASSRSRIGKGDLGQNPRNIKELMRAIQTPDS